MIQVLNKKGSGVFDERDESLLAAFGAHAAVALDRAQLIESYVEKQRMEETLKLAHEIQMSMLPKRFPPFPHRTEFDLYAVIEPAREVGETSTIFCFLTMTTLVSLLAMCPEKGSQPRCLCQ